MENTSRETAEEPVLLSWEMPERMRKLFHTISFMEQALILGVLGVVVWKSHDWPNISLAVTILLILYTSFAGRPRVMRPFWMAATLVQATTSGVRIMTVTTVEFSVPWTDVRALKRGPYGFTVLSTPSVDIHLPIPPEVRDKLIAILRETSNARIVGFGPEEG